VAAFVVTVRVRCDHIFLVYFPQKRNLLRICTSQMIFTMKILEVTTLNGFLCYHLVRFPYKGVESCKSMMFTDVCIDFHEKLVD
jgi:hypothetical protein